MEKDKNIDCNNYLRGKLIQLLFIVIICCGWLLCFIHLLTYCYFILCLAKHKLTKIEKEHMERYGYWNHDNSYFYLTKYSGNKLLQMWQTSTCE